MHKLSKPANVQKYFSVHLLNENIFFIKNITNTFWMAQLFLELFLFNYCNEITFFIIIGRVFANLFSNTRKSATTKNYAFWQGQIVVITYYIIFYFFFASQKQSCHCLSIVGLKVQTNGLIPV